MALLCSSIFFGEIAENLAQAQSVAANLVGVSWTYAFAGSAYLGRTFKGFVCSIEQAVSWQYQMYFLRYLEHFLDVESTFLQISRLGSKQDWVQHHAVADDVDLTFLEYARRDRTKHILLVIKFKRVACIWATLETGDYVVAWC